MKHSKAMVSNFSHDYALAARAPAITPLFQALKKRKMGYRIKADGPLRNLKQGFLLMCHWPLIGSRQSQNVSD